MATQRGWEQIGYLLPGSARSRNRRRKKTSLERGSFGKRRTGEKIRAKGKGIRKAQAEKARKGRAGRLFTFYTPVHLKQTEMV